MTVRPKLPAHLAALVAAGVLLTGCTVAPMTETPSPQRSSPPTLAPGATGATPQATNQSMDQGTAEIELTITGGSHSGSYRAVAHNACASDVVENRFVVVYGSNAAIDGFVAMQLIVRDATLADEDETDDFGLTLSLGGPAGGTTYTIDPRGGQGDGSVLLELLPRDATVDLAATATDGSTVELSIICSSVSG